MNRVFRNAKLHVANAVMLKFFDPDKDIVIECDASGVGIRGTLLQDGHPVTCSLAKPSLLPSYMLFQY